MEDYIKETLIASPYPFWLTILLFALITGGVQYIIFYFMEKGKNLATKEDVGDITQQIESVKDSFNKDLANLNADLALLTNLQTNFLTEKKDIIIKFNTLLEKWIHSFLYTDKVDLFNTQSIDLDQQRISAYYEDLQTCFSTMKIYIENEKLNKMANDTLTYYLEFAHHKAVFLLEAKRFNIEQDAINSDTKSTPSLKKIKQTEIIKKRQKALEEFVEKRKQNIDEITQRKISFEKECRSYIYKLFSKGKPA